MQKCQRNQKKIGSTLIWNFGCQKGLKTQNCKFWPKNGLFALHQGQNWPRCTKWGLKNSFRTVKGIFEPMTYKIVLFTNNYPPQDCPPSSQSWGGQSWRYSWHQMATFGNKWFSEKSNRPASEQILQATPMDERMMCGAKQKVKDVVPPKKSNIPGALRVLEQQPDLR